MSSKVPRVTAAPRRDHAALAQGYVDGVVAGRIAAGKMVRQACQRHLADLARVSDPSWPYRFEPNRGAAVCRFVETLPHTKGKWAKVGQLLELQPWQCFLVVVLFGWLYKANERRRFRSAYLEIPRKNGKSPLAAALGLYMLLADGEFGAEVYCGATTEKQAWEVFRPAKVMVERSPRLQARFGAEVWAKALITPTDGSKFEPVIGDPGDGSSPSCAIVDEYHEHDTSAVPDTMETGMGAREQPLLLIITTAGYNPAGPCHDRHDELRRVLDGTVVNDNLFGCVFGIDASDDWADPKILAKANPNFGISIEPEFLLSQQRQAMANPVQQNRFKTKHLNVWCSVLTGWMNMQAWNLSADPLLDEDELLGCDCWIAFDLASKTDLCSEQRLYRRFLPNQAKPHFYLFGRYWLPEAAIEEAGPNHGDYVKWVKTGHLIQTEGATVDFELISETIVEDARRCGPTEVLYDPFNATQTAQDLMADGVHRVVEFVQNPQSFAVPMDEMTAAVKDGRFHHDGNPITAWCMSNVVARPTKKGLFAPRKAKNHQKIDGAVAAMMAMARASGVAEPEPKYDVFFL